jgi:DNA-binding NarL/FixJ family response regulator
MEDQLTPREVEVLKLIACGQSGKQIAEKLGIAFRTARSHRSNLMEKLDVHDTASLVRYAIRTGLIQA